MRWLLIALLVSLAAMLIAAAGMTLHIWARRTRSRSKHSAGAAQKNGQTEESDADIEI
jgi:protein-S-isoprenylcysteine O-methyltransferase Ste14